MTDYLLNGVAEHLRSASVPGDDPVVVVHAPDRVRRIRHEAGPAPGMTIGRNTVDRCGMLGRRRRNAHVPEFTPDLNRGQEGGLHLLVPTAQQRQ